MTPDASKTWAISTPWDFHECTRLLRTGSADPTVRRESHGLWRTARTASGPVTARLTVGPETVRADTWGPGATAALDEIPRWIGLHEAPWTLPSHPVVDRLLHQHRGVRLTDTRDVFTGLVNLVLQQLVTWNEAAMTWRRLCEVVGEPAPGPTDMLLAPSPSAIQRASSATLQSAGIGIQRVRTIVEVAHRAHRLQRAADLPTDEASHLVQLVRGIGPWTATMLLSHKLGRPEPIVTGDYHLPNAVAYALAGEERADDARMLELLAPFEGQAARVVRLIFAARITAPRRGPKRAWRRF